MFDSIKSITVRKTLSYFVTIGLMCITSCEAPTIVVISGSMEPGFKLGDVLFSYTTKDIRVGDIVVFNIDGRDIPIVHRVIKVHEPHNIEETYMLTKGDKNNVDDTILYNDHQQWLQRHHTMGKAVWTIATRVKNTATLKTFNPCYFDLFDIIDKVVDEVVAKILESQGVKDEHATINFD